MTFSDDERCTSIIFLGPKKGQPMKEYGRLNTLSRGELPHKAIGRPKWAMRLSGCH